MTLWKSQFTASEVKVLKQDKMYTGYCSVQRFSFQHSLFEGGESHPIAREVICRPPAVAVLPYDPETEQIILIEQFRVGAFSNGENPWLLEIVAGMIDPGETPTETAIRETLEETGCQLLSLIPICEYLVSPGISTEKTTVFCGKIKAPSMGGVYGLAHDDEDIKVHIFKVEDVFKLLHSGKLINSSTIIALQWFALNRFSLHFPQ